MYSLPKRARKTTPATLTRAFAGNMASLWLHLVFSVIASFASSTSGACSSFTFSSSRAYATCRDLPHLSSSIHWSYDLGASSLSIAFLAPPRKPGGWISWGINPKANGMVGSQALLTSTLSDGSMMFRTYNITNYDSITPSPIEFEITDPSTLCSGGLMGIFGSLKLPAGTSMVKQVWQVGSSVVNGVPQVHEFQADNLQAMGSLNLLEGAITSPSTHSITLKRNVHGILNFVGWGILLPTGAMFARYLKSFEFSLRTQFRLHVTCQLIGYGVGICGWAIGVSLDCKSKGIPDTTHRNVGYTLFFVATFQAFSLVLRPQRVYEYRSNWNVFHQCLGYTIIVLSIINIIRGITILNLAHGWTVAYDVVLCIFAAIALCLEFLGRRNVLRRNAENPGQAEAEA